MMLHQFSCFKIFLLVIAITATLCNALPKPQPSSYLLKAVRVLCTIRSGCTTTREAHEISTMKEEIVKLNEQLKLSQDKIEMLLRSKCTTVLIGTALA